MEKEKIQIASVMQRFKGYLADSILLILVLLAMKFILGGMFKTDITFLSNILFSVFAFIYFIFLNQKWHGQTIGKKLVKTKIVSMDGKLTQKQILVRYSVLFLFVLLFPMISGLFPHISVLESISSLGFLIFLGSIIFNREHRGIHDVIAKTKVISVT